jgi:hypothetical protein
MMIRMVAATLTASCLAWSAAVWRWQHALPPVTKDSFDMPRVGMPRSLAVLATESESVLVANDMFRLPDDVVHGQSSPGVAGAAAAHASLTRPSLTVKGIVGGPPWQAIVDGLPGQVSGIIVQAGGTYGGVTIATVGRDSVRVRAGDTTWTLYYRRGS